MMQLLGLGDKFMGYTVTDIRKSKEVYGTKGTIKAAFPFSIVEQNLDKIERLPSAEQE